MLLFVKQKTAYEMRISDWSSACALPILLELRHHGARERVELTVVAGVIGNRLGVGLEEVLGVRVLADARALSTLDQHLHGAVRQLQELQHGADGADGGDVGRRRVVLRSVLLGAQKSTEALRVGKEGVRTCGYRWWPNRLTTKL